MRLQVSKSFIFYFQFMKISIYLLIVILFATAVFCADEQPTHLTYFVEYEEEQEEDFIEITLNIEAQSRSLVEAISNAGKVAAQVSALANGYCKEYAKKGKGDCKDAVDVSKFEIEPQYQMVRKEATFSTFVVSHEITISVFFPDNVGYLVDSFLKYPDLTLKGFEWKAIEEKDSEEAAIKEGLDQGQGLCEQVGLSLGRIIDIEEVIEEDEAAAEEGGDEGEQEEQEDAPEVTVYKFQVECVPKGKTSKK